MRASISLIALLVAASIATSPACYAQQSTQTVPNAHEKRINTCDTQASSKKLEGDARESFMSECLSRLCNRQASNRHLSGDARKSFVARCLKGQ
jgi:psiF repeat